MSRPIPCLPRRFFKCGKPFDHPTPRLNARQQYIATQSIRRYESRHGPAAMVFNIILPKP